MGFLSKIFKPVSKVLDKIIPNEIKPALPYLAAFAPMMLGPGIMGSGMAQRALMSGGMNIFGQLSQEGNEGDINLLSAGLGALSGAMTAPGTPGKAIGVDKFDNTIYARGTGAGSFKDFAQTGIDKYGADSAMGEILGGAAKASKFMTDPGLMKYGIPAAQGTGDVMFAEAKRAQDAYEDSQAADSEADAASAARRAAAIRQSMEAYGFTDEEIEDAIYAAGYKTGGRVGFTKGGDVMKAIERGISPSEALDILKEFKKIKEKYGYEMSFDNYLDGEMFSKGGRVGLEFGGIPAALENIEDDEMKDTAKFVSAMDDMDIPIMDIVEDFEIQFKRKPNSLEELKQYYKEKYDYKGPADTRIKETIEESFRETAAEGGLMNLGGKEMDLRGGGFVPIGKKEKADDVPARLSKNEFVMTADAVRAAGGGSVNEGAKRMYETMNKLEAQV